MNIHLLIQKVFIDCQLFLIYNAMFFKEVWNYKLTVTISNLINANSGYRQEIPQTYLVWTLISLKARIMYYPSLHFQPLASCLARMCLRTHTREIIDG